MCVNRFITIKTLVRSVRPRAMPTFEHTIGSRYFNQ
jgi:hypothetical protein